jgi:hypothetical protein
MGIIEAGTSTWQPLTLSSKSSPRRQSETPPSSNQTPSANTPDNSYPCRLPRVQEPRHQRPASMGITQSQRQANEPPPHRCSYQEFCHACPCILHIRTILNTCPTLSTKRPCKQDLAGPTSAWTSRASLTTISPAPHATRTFTCANATEHSANGAAHLPASTNHPRKAAPRGHFPKTSAPQLRPAKPTPPLSYIPAPTVAAITAPRNATAPSVSLARQHSPPPTSAKHTTWPPINATRPTSARDLHQSAPQLAVITRNPHHHSYRDPRPRCKISLRTTAATTPASPRLPAPDTHHLHAETPTSTTK